MSYSNVAEICSHGPWQQGSTFCTTVFIGNVYQAHSYQIHRRSAIELQKLRLTNYGQHLNIDTKITFTARVVTTMTLTFCR